MVGDKVEEAKWKGLGVNDYWLQMKDILMQSAQDICGMTKGPRRHKETWWLLKQLGKRRQSTESRRNKTRVRQGWSIRRVDKM